ncbi:glycosyltransferase family 4 protein [Botrimarina colliarenosi]|nr:glycosyltransferase [Botrimarina colliarenosi]
MSDRAVVPATAAPSGADPIEGRRLRVLQVAHACHPHQSMESRIGWYRAVHAAQQHDVTVLHGEATNDGLLRDEAQRLGIGDRLHFIGIDRCWWGDLYNRSATTYYMGYRLWHRCALREAQKLHAERPFDLAHQTTFCGFREPGEAWRLGVPFVWGPVGGTQAFPARYLSELGLRGAWIEVCRNAINAWQLRFSRRVRLATRRAAVLIAATHQASQDIQRATGRKAPVQLETALDIPISPAREPRRAGEPLRILWSGRLRAWKTLPLLLKALPLLPPDVDWRLRVLGVGPSEAAWRRLANRLGIADRIEWLGWPDYRATLPHYQWADCFAFTSMRDTSGTGLLEALAAGSPIVGVDHQGAADIMTSSCAMPVPVGSPNETVTGMAVAMTRLAREPVLWRQLSEGARAEAQQHMWSRQAETLLRWYADAYAVESSTARERRAARTDRVSSNLPANQPSVGPSVG